MNGSNAERFCGEEFNIARFIFGKENKFEDVAL